MRRQMAAWAAAAVGAAPEESLVMSTGVIGSMLPMEKIRAGIEAAAAQLGDDPQSLENAARGIMTTDTVPKVRGREVVIGGIPTRITGIAKGAAMIGPNMSTMLSVIMTDATLQVADAQAALMDAVDESFHCISVDGHMSTNDTVILLGEWCGGAASRGPSAKVAAGTSTAPLSGKSLADFRATLWKSAKTWPKQFPPTAKAPRTWLPSRCTAAARGRMHCKSARQSPTARW